MRYLFIVFIAVIAVLAAGILFSFVRTGGTQNTGTSPPPGAAGR
ncbi:hypothetical protein [Methylobacterium flocculans]|nr:hypothetical protein [Methylobacterium sp. FF17]